MSDTFEEWKERYALVNEPNYSPHTEADCLAAYQAGRAEARELLEDARDALHELLQDTQHRDHDCGDEKYCPVLYAKRALAAIRAHLGETK